MELTLPCLLALVYACQYVSANPMEPSQAPLAQYNDQHRPSVTFTAEELSNFMMTSLSDSQREDVMVQLWEQQDVVDVMKFTGHGEGLEEERLVQVFGEKAARIMTEGDKLRLKKAGHDFMDITDHPDLGQRNSLRARVKTDLPSVGLTKETKSFTTAMMDDLDDKHLRADIAKLSSFWNRNYRSPWGLLSSNWIHDQVEAILSSADDEKIRTSVSKFHHKFLQNSIIARIESVDQSVGDKELIILSAHEDSLNYKLPFYRAPGADDDGSGTVTILQVLRSMVEHTFVPPSDLAVEFHWYAGEEGGLLGSQDIAAAYENRGEQVKGMLHMDMTAFVKDGTEPIIAFFDTDVDKNLTSFCTQLVDEYIPLRWNMTNCGASCGSDHMSFNKAGYPVSFATEALVRDFSYNIHTVRDDMDQQGQYNFGHMLEFVKLGIAFIAELAARQ